VTTYVENYMLAESRENRPRRLMSSRVERIIPTPMSRALRRTHEGRGGEEYSEGRRNMHEEEQSAQQSA
jgi:hypothetical protein